MADLRNGQVAVDYAANETQYGPAGTRRRDRHSLYFNVGGSSDTYDVTLNYESTNGHFCKKQGTGKPCQGNLHGKGQKYGAGKDRTRSNPQHWCKHVAAAMNEPELIETAMEINAITWGEVRATVKPPVPAFPETAEQAPATERVKALEAALASAKAEEQAEQDSEIREGLRELVKRFGADRVAEIVASFN